MKKQLEDRDEDTNKILQDSKEAFRSFGFQFNEDGTYEKFISPGKKMEGQYRFSAGKDSIFFHSRPGIANMNEEKYKFEIQGSQLNIWFYAGGMQHALVFQK